MKRTSSGEGAHVAELRTARVAVKYGIACMAMLGGLHNITDNMQEGMMVALTVMVAVLSAMLGRVFHLCLVHNLCLVYGVASVALMMAERVTGTALEAGRWAMCCSGILLAVVALWMARAH